MHIKKISTLFLSILLSVSLFAQYISRKIVGNEILNQKMGNVQFFPKSYPLRFPVINLYDIEPLLLKFDIFSTSEEPFIYTITLCNSDWSVSELDFMEYIDGYEENTLYPFSLSFNTEIDYVHYQLELPNEDISFLNSGNYILNILNENKEKILTRRFIVYEPQTELRVQLDNMQSDIYAEQQELLVDLSSNNIPSSKLAGNISLSVMQNGNWQTLQLFNKYNTNGSGSISFNTPGQIVFMGVNEFRFLDIKSLRFISERVDRIDYNAPDYNVYLKPDMLRGQKQYFSSVDLNGNFFIRNQESHDEDMLDAEYAFVHFQLKSEIPLGADVYIEGALTDWNLQDNYMKYNPGTGSYEAKLLLKQGIYNYRYVTKEYSNNKVYSDITEGSHFQTGNDYQAFLYYRELGEFNDRVIGYSQLSTGREVKEHDPNKELNIIEQLLKEMPK